MSDSIIFKDILHLDIGIVPIKLKDLVLFCIVWSIIYKIVKILKSLALSNYSWRVYKGQTGLSNISRCPLTKTWWSTIYMICNGMYGCRKTH